MCQTAIYFCVSVPGGEREGAGAWQAEGQTWCSAEWVSAAGPCSCCGLDIILVHWPGSSHRPAVLVLPLFVKQRRAKSNFKRSRQQWEHSFGWIELLWHSECKSFFHIWQDDSVFFLPWQLPIFLCLTTLLLVCWWVCRATWIFS